MSVILLLASLLVSLVRAKVQFLGVAIAGGDFGCQIDGSCPTGSTRLPLTNLGGGDGAAQMKHFVKDDGMNMFRIPISWQFLTANRPSSPLDPTNLSKYDQIIQACLSTGAYCMIDIHNFARYNGGIIGQGGPTDDQFVALWTQLATKYAAVPKIVFELMNEPHDLNITIWAQTCQKVVTAIRNAGAKTHMILLPGTNFDSAATLVESGSAEALLGLANPDGSTDNLLLDIHKYLDVDNSGTHAECVTDNTDAFRGLAEYLRGKGRMGIVSETGASGAESCLTAFCAQNRVINENSDVFLGLVAWGAGSFGEGYSLSLTPARKGGGMVDNQVMRECVLGTWVEGGEVVASPGTTATGTGSGSSVTWSATDQTTVSGSASSVRDGTATSVLGQGVSATITTSGAPRTTSGTSGTAKNSSSPVGSPSLPASSVSASSSQSVSGSPASTFIVSLGMTLLFLATAAIHNRV